MIPRVDPLSVKLNELPCQDKPTEGPCLAKVDKPFHLRRLHISHAIVKSQKIIGNILPHCMHSLWEYFTERFVNHVLKKELIKNRDMEGALRT